MAYEEDETGDSTPAYSPLDDPYYYKKVLARYGGGTETPGPLGKAWEGVKAVAGPPLEAFGKVVGAPKAGLDAISRAVARAQGLDVPDTMTMGQMVRESFYPTNPEHGGLLDYEYKPENPLTPGAIAAMAARAVPGAAVLPQERGIPRAVAGEVGQFGAEMLTDPITYLMPGVGGINAVHKLDAIRRAKIAEQVLQEAPDIAKYAPKLAGWAEEAKAALPGVLSGVDRPIATAAEKTLHRGFQAQMGLGAVEGAAEAKKKLAEGDTEGAVQALTQAGLSAGMVLAPPILSQLRRGEQARALAKTKPPEAKPGLEPTEALPTLPPETAPPALDLAEAVPAYATERPPQPPPREVGPGFYSQLRTVVDDPKTQGTQTGEQWLKFLSDPKRQVKKAEMEDTGLAEWLKGKAGERVTRQQVQDYLDQNEVRVEEVVKSDRSKYSGRSPDDLLAEAGREERIAQQWQRNGDESQAQRHFAAAEELNRAAEGLDVESGSTSGMPKFSQWQTPGGSNYRELLLTLPRKPLNEAIEWSPDPEFPNEVQLGKIKGAEKPRYVVIRDKRTGKWSAGDYADARTNRLLDAQKFDTPEEAQRSAAIELGSEREGTNFTAGHYAEPNVLAHVRFNERTDADGKKVLFVEEIQSDWGEKGRKEGFRGKGGRSLDEIDREMDSFHDQLASGKITEEEFRQKLNAAQAERNQIQNGHPTAPFVTSTPAWTDLAVKRITKWAADHGFDRIAWTPGKVQSERYNLGKYVDSIRWYKDGDGTYRIQGEKDGSVVLSKKGVEPKELPNTVGKDLTDKILAASQQGQTGAFSGLDLQVGGEGMKAYYDEMVPQSFGRLAKREGGKLGTTNVDVTNGARMYPEDAANAIAAGDTLPVQSFDIPPTMKGKLQPLYKTEPGAEGVQPIDPVVARKRLADLYPDNTYIKELPDGTYDIALPGDRGRVIFRPGVDKIEFNREAFRKGYGREPEPGETPVGVTYALPHSALVEILQGADPRVALHEHWHVIKNLGNLTAEQEAKLQTLYPTEEAQADAFANWMQQAKPKHTIFTKLWDSLKLLGEFITGKREFLSGEKKAQYVTPEEAAGEVFRQAQEGALTERTAGGEASVPKYAVAPVMAPEGAAPALIGEESLKALQPASGFQLPGEGPIQRATGEPPRVETRASNLQSALNEQRDLGIPARDVLLDRDTARNWKSLTPEVRKTISEWSDDKIFNIASRRNLDDVEVQALDAVTRGRREAKEAARLDYQAAKGTPEEGTAWSAYVSSLASYLPLERLAANDGTGTARALAARARIMEAARTPDRAFLRQVIRELPNVTDKDSQQLLAMFETGDPRLSEALRSYMTGGWKKFWTLFRANLIGIPSEFANITGNTFVQGIEIADKAAAAGADWFLRKIKPGSRKERYLGEAGADFSGMIHALPKALADFANERMVQIYRRAITGEARKIAPGTPLEYQVSPFRNKELGVPGLGRAARLLATPLDALGAGDDAFQAIIYPGELAARSYRLAAQRLQKARGPEVDAEAQRVLSDIFESPDKYADLIKSARDATARRVYRDKPWESVSALQNFASRHQWLNAVIPFVKTPANILRYTIRHSPAGFLTPEMTKAFREFKEGRISQGDFADQLAPRLTGTLIAGAFAGLAKAGFLTGAGPKDPADRQALLRTGWQPYSIVLTAENGSKVYIPFSRFDPLSQSLGVAADVAEMKDAKDINDAMSRGIGIIISNLSNRTYMRGLADFASAYQDPQRYMQTYIANLSNALTPSILDKTAQAIDPYFRETKPLGQGGQGWTGLPSRILNTVESQVPGLSQKLPVRYGPTGERSVRPGGEGAAGAIGRFFLPSIPTTSVPGTELESELARLGLAPSTPRPYLTINGKKVFVRPQDREVLSRADEQAASELRRKLPSISYLPDTIEEGGNRSKQYIIEQTFAKHRSAARQMLLRSASFRSYAREQLQKESEA